MYEFVSKKIINPIELIRAYNFHKNNQIIKSSEDLELMLYSKIIRNDMPYGTLKIST